MTMKAENRPEKMRFTEAEKKEHFLGERDVAGICLQEVVFALQWITRLGMRRSSRKVVN